MLLNPFPTGVVMGPFNAVLFFSMLFKVSSGIKTPHFSYAVFPASASSHSILSVAASIISLAACIISKPIPSPGINVTFLFILPPACS